jgi:CrcB protein
VATEPGADRERLDRRPAGRTARHHADADAVTPSVTSRGWRAEPSVLAAVALGAALGGPARYGVAQVIHVAPDTFPWATFWTNMSGSLALGFVMATLVERFPPSRYLRPFVAIGFLGAYTTYSTFAVETVLLVRDGHAQIGLVYAAASLLGGLVAVWAGIWAARAIPLPRRSSSQPR